MFITVDFKQKGISKKRYTLPFNKKVTLIDFFPFQKQKESRQANKKMKKHIYK